MKSAGLGIMIFDIIYKEAEFIYDRTGYHKIAERV